MEPNLPTTTEQYVLRLNRSEIRITEPHGLQLLDFLRYSVGLVGTKIGCREGDCGACTVLVGEKENDQIQYRAVTSCLTPLGNVLGKHVVTIEGVNLDGGRLNLVQRCLVENGGTQCGFCTVGFVMSLVSYCLTTTELSLETARRYIDGNICRCTGYKSIERAIISLNGHIAGIEVLEGEERIQRLIDLEVIPEYFRETEVGVSEKPSGKEGTLVAGGTDLYVQRGHRMRSERLRFVHNLLPRQVITVEGEWVRISANTSVTQFASSQIIQDLIPGIKEHLMLVGSNQIRNLATLGGNIVNASPIGDLSIILLSLDAVLRVRDNTGKEREVPLRKFYTGYKQMKLGSGEIIHSISIPNRPVRFNFEKVSKRTHLDIASVNSAMAVDEEDFSISVGGVAPIPLYLEHTSQYLSGKELNPQVVAEAVNLLEQEIAPISDVRGSRKYKRLLARNLLLAHISKLISEELVVEVLKT